MNDKIRIIQRLQRQLEEIDIEQLTATELKNITNNIILLGKELEEEKAIDEYENFINDNTAINIFSMN